MVFFAVIQSTLETESPLPSAGPLKAGCSVLNVCTPSAVFTVIQYV